MEAETLLPAGAQPSGEVALTMGKPCGAVMAPDMGLFSGTGARQRSAVFVLSRIRQKSILVKPEQEQERSRTNKSAVAS